MTLAFIVNSGSSSIKYQVIDTATETAVHSGLIERIGESGGDAPDHTTGMRIILDGLGSSDSIAVVGHRVVHGGSRFDRATLVTEAVLADIDDLSPLAPLHNPANLTGVRAAMLALPDVPHVAVFDTAFHQSMPPESYVYAIDTEIAGRYGVRKYGFHGTSVKFVTTEAARALGNEPEHTNLIVLHLGNGASVTAVRGGRSYDTSMGLTPLQGLVMGTRSGDIDAAVVAHLTRVAGMDVDAVDDLLNKRGGMLGMTGYTDMRDVLAAADDGDERAATGLAVWRHRVQSYIGSYIAQLGRVDALVFTAGIGENSPSLRARACGGLEHLGIELDNAANDVREPGVRDIGKPGTPIRILVVPTNEELEIARQAMDVIS